MKSALGNNMTQQILFQYQERFGLGSVRFALNQPCADIAAPSVKSERHFDIFGNLKDWGSSNQRTLPMCRILDHLHEQLCTWFEREWAAPFPVFFFFFSFLLTCFISFQLCSTAYTDQTAHIKQVSFLGGETSKTPLYHFKIHHNP